jgi:hypothetical protein
VNVPGDPCTGSRLRLAGTLVGHNGRTASTPARALVTGCPATARGRLRHGVLRIVAGHGRDAKRLKRVRVRLARGLTGPHGRIVTVRLHRARSATLRIPVRGRAHGPSLVTLTRTNGRRFTVRLR